ncbi:MAG: helix-turn-helix domain-containing protein [Bacteroidetes bacterium]|jgi:hypothetical protein|nr:helix-turn-helix domain-containing protein [Bacteroidota bacterium]MBT3422070.1 helix-turn-helix domain-containing protein [Bacteroidota bacterium]MBT3933374.1 helix-turn-helix domain-containing protein [Bacteroidota bacterium]MBT4339139.1 helix-turn-helix domain-containing protein [Bacteroidota bacterium]MBT4730206.1 helix-turn-helix domain-containing protein [Bacteroidota bacterium]
MSNQTFTFLPQDVVDELLELAQNLRIVLPKLQEGSTSSKLGDWIPEEEAKKLLGRKTTWFYNKRKSGELDGRKRGNKWWYRLSDIQAFIES